jgi:hypothetical protein
LAVADDGRSHSDLFRLGDGRLHALCGRDRPGRATSIKHGDGGGFLDRHDAPTGVDVAGRDRLEKPHGRRNAVIVQAAEVGFDEPLSERLGVEFEEAFGDKEPDQQIARGGDRNGDHE